MGMIIILLKAKFRKALNAILSPFKRARHTRSLLLCARPPLSGSGVSKHNPYKGRYKEPASFGLKPYIKCHRRNGGTK